MRPEIESFVERTKKLPSLPSLYYELVRAIQNPHSSIGDVALVLRRDQSLTGRLLKLANSALYGFPTQIGTLDEAVQLIGMREIQNLVLATSVLNRFDHLPSDLVDTNSFWKHSIACATASALLAEWRHELVPERFFIGGLLHDIGRLILYLNAPAESRQILARCKSAGELCCPVEQEVLGFDHATLGGELVAHWKLPPSLAEMVRGHHHPDESAVGLSDAFLIHYADFLTTALEFGNSGEYLVTPLVVPPNCESSLPEASRMVDFVEEIERKCESVFSILTEATK